MIKYQDIYIPEPCIKIHYEWLPYDSTKRYCSFCEKPVYDFRNKDEKFLNEIWKKHNGNFCGAFRNDQFEKKSAPKPLIQTISTSKTSIFKFLFFFWSFVSKAQVENNTIPVNKELNIIDTTSNTRNKFFMVLTDDCTNCLDQYHIEVYINHKFYNRFLINDSTNIILPSSIKDTDTVTINEIYVKKRIGWKNKITKRKKIEFKFGEKNIISIKTTRKFRIRLIYKRDSIGCPKFRF